MFLLPTQPPHSLYICGQISAKYLIRLHLHLPLYFCKFHENRQMDSRKKPSFYEATCWTVNSTLITEQRTPTGECCSEKVSQQSSNSNSEKQISSQSLGKTVLIWGYWTSRSYSTLILALSPIWTCQHRKHLGGKKYKLEGSKPLESMASHLSPYNRTPAFFITITPNF